MQLKKYDFYFDEPSNLNINGNDIEEDFINTIQHLKLDKIIDVEKERKIIKESSKI